MCFFFFGKDLFAFLFVPFLVPKNSQCCDPNEEEDGCAKNRRFACVCIHKFAFQSLMVVSFLFFFFGVNNLANLMRARCAMEALSFRDEC